MGTEHVRDIITDRRFRQLNDVIRPAPASSTRPLLNMTCDRVNCHKLSPPLVWPARGPLIGLLVTPWFPATPEYPQFDDRVSDRQAPPMALALNCGSPIIYSTAQGSLTSILVLLSVTILRQLRLSSGLNDPQAIGRPVIFGTCTPIFCRQKTGSVVFSKNV